MSERVLIQPHLLSPGPIPIAFERSAASQNDYADLRRRLSQRGLFERQYRYYAIQALFTVGLLSATLVLLLAAEALWLKLLAAVLLAFVFTQIGYIGHDAGHRQIFARPWQDDLVLLTVGLLLGISRSWWFDSHNLHHSDPNDLRRDPHTALPALAFSEDQARAKRGIARSLTRFQAVYFFPMLLLQGLGMRIASVGIVAGGKARYPRAEAVGIFVHFLLYAGLLLSALSLWQIGLFVVIHQGLMGLYMGSVFAPNHKGMLIVGSDCELDFLRRQVLTTRNVKPHPLTDIWCGGLNYQVEHHLFPNLPRNKLKEARPIVMAFCNEHSIPYYETGLLQSYAEVTRYLHAAAAPLRSARTRT